VEPVLMARLRGLFRSQNPQTICWKHCPLSQCRSVTACCWYALAPRPLWPRGTTSFNWVSSRVPGVIGPGKRLGQRVSSGWGLRMSW